MAGPLFTAALALPAYSDDALCHLHWSLGQQKSGYHVSGVLALSPLIIDAQQ